MRIRDMIPRTGQFFSLEFFPPKDRTKWPDFFKVVDTFRTLQPLFASVTYGAGGSTRDHTMEIVNRLKNEYEVEPMAHLTCVDADRAYIERFLDDLAGHNIDNVLALRGDAPKGREKAVADDAEFRHAADLVSFIRGRHPDMGVGVAGYPEKHPEAASLDADIGHLKAKLDQGGDFIITQMFFENRFYFDFVKRCRAAGITVPIIPAILPIMNLAGLKRILGLCGATIPGPFLRALEEADASGGNAAVQRLGISHARFQIADLLDREVPGVHLYTLNQVEACMEIVQDLELCKRLGAC
ncbi:MAG: methylenetetrahydrofolate reductase [NAD(P)H] [Desulfovibrionaceae bacterium]